MTFRDEAVAALEAGRRAELGADNPYAGQSLALAKLWLQGYETMLATRFYGSGAGARYIRAQRNPGR